MTLTTFIWFLVTSLGTPCHGHITDCVNPPAPPLHGTLRYVRGVLRARLKCPKDHDLPVTAPGTGGVLTCDPEVKTHHFDLVRIPECLPHKTPENLVMPAMVMFTASDCKMKTEAEVNVTEELRKHVPVQCSAKVSCEWTDIESVCAENYNRDEGEKGNEKQIDVTLNLRTKTYNPDVSVQKYLDLLRTIKTVYLKDFKVDISGVTYKGTTLGFWTSSCGNHKNTLGSELDIHMIASCRGCPRNYFMENATRECWQCDPNYYTETAFADTCHRCPPESYFKSEEDFKKTCLERDGV